MALVPCPECNQQVSTAATTCPHCGYPLKELIINVIKYQYNVKKIAGLGIGFSDHIFEKLKEEINDGWEIVAVIEDHERGGIVRQVYSVILKKAIAVQSQIKSSANCNSSNANVKVQPGNIPSEEQIVQAFKSVATNTSFVRNIDYPIISQLYQVLVFDGVPASSMLTEELTGRHDYVVNKVKEKLAEKNIEVDEELLEILKVLVCNAVEL